MSNARGRQPEAGGFLQAQMVVRTALAGQVAPLFGGCWRAQAQSHREGAQRPARRTPPQGRVLRHTAGRKEKIGSSRL